MSKKNDSKYVIYSIFVKGVISLNFSSKQYTPEGAKKRCLNLTKDFPGLQLIAMNAFGEKILLYPTAEDIKIRQRERRRNLISHAYISY